MEKNNEQLINFTVSKTMHKQYKQACQHYMYMMRAPLLRAMTDIINQYNTEVGRERKSRKRKVV